MGICQNKYGDNPNAQSNDSLHRRSPSVTGKVVNRSGPQLHIVIIIIIIILHAAVKL
jgi:hypothetical protein